MSASYFRLASENLQCLIDAVVVAGYRLLAPSVSQSAVVYKEISHVEDLAKSYSDAQSPGQYRLEKAAHQRYFFWTNTVQSIKPLLFRPRELLWQVGEKDGQIEFSDIGNIQSERPIAVLGPRACDLAALKLQDQHFLASPQCDPFYAHRRHRLFIIAVECAQSAATCFCASTGDGPEIREDADIILNELDSEFLLRPRSAAGEQLLKGLTLEPAGRILIHQAQEQTQYAKAQQQRKMPTSLSFDEFAPDNPAWEWVKNHCLSCGNCTSVCPTCFCHNEYDESDIIGKQSKHFRQWSSCFTQEHSYMHGITIRNDTVLRYKQWISHKLVHWQLQYGRSGCVGCGRCITWCPVGIDITTIANNFTTVPLQSAE